MSGCDRNRRVGGGGGAYLVVLLKQTWHSAFGVGAGWGWFGDDGQCDVCPGSGGMGSGLLDNKCNAII